MNISPEMYATRQWHWQLQRLHEELTEVTRTLDNYQAFRNRHPVPKTAAMWAREAVAQEKVGSNLGLRIVPLRELLRRRPEGIEARNVAQAAVEYAQHHLTFFHARFPEHTHREALLLRDLVRAEERLAGAEAEVAELDGLVADEPNPCCHAAGGELYVICDNLFARPSSSITAAPRGPAGDANPGNE